MSTIYDVAKEAGVSIGTVSYVINKSKKVRQETVERVEEAMRKLNYQPSASAKALALGRSDIISLTYPSNLIDFQMVLNSFAIAIGNVLEETDFRLTILPLPNATELQTLEASVQARMMDGVILLNTLLHDKRVDYLKSADLPFVMIGRCLDNTGLYYVDADIKAAARLQVEHLVKLGHRKISYIGYQAMDENLSSVGYHLQNAFREALQDFGLPVDDCFFIKSCQPEEIAYELELLLKSPNAPTAVSGAYEAAVMGVLKTTAKLGMSVPDDLAIIGYADSPLYPMLTPPITVVFDQIMSLGRMAADMLLTLIDGKEPKEPQILLKPCLVPRASTGE
ncbi:LacI family DNA-binding transcriptional regulator [Chloroflexota bacterium]|nr:LacI family DNA-binding transcriptional regulator [Chloroflexota bacterium]